MCSRYLGEYIVLFVANEMQINRCNHFDGSEGVLQEHKLRGRQRVAVFTCFGHEREIASYHFDWHVHPYLSCF